MGRAGWWRESWQDKEVIGAGCVDRYSVLAAATWQWAAAAEEGSKPKDKQVHCWQSEA